jgi:hypothetical protein
VQTLRLASEGQRDQAETKSNQKEGAHQVFTETAPSCVPALQACVGLVPGTRSLMSLARQGAQNICSCGSDRSSSRCRKCTGIYNHIVQQASGRQQLRVVLT